MTDPLNFTGGTILQVDPQGRIKLPPGVRGTVRRVLVCPGREGSILLYPKEGMERIVAAASNSLEGPEARIRLRNVLAQTHELDLDAQSRIQVPGELLARAGIVDQAHLIGAGDHFELRPR